MEWFSKRASAARELGARSADFTGDARRNGWIVGMLVVTVGLVWWLAGWRLALLPAGLAVHYSIRAAFALATSRQLACLEGD